MTAHHSIPPHRSGRCCNCRVTCWLSTAIIACFHLRAPEDYWQAWTQHCHRLALEQHPGYSVAMDLHESCWKQESQPYCHVLTLVPFLCLYFSLVRAWVGVGILCVVTLFLYFCVWPGMVPNQRQLFIVVSDWEPYLGSLFSHYDLWVVVFCVCGYHTELFCFFHLFLLFFCILCSV